MKDIKYELCGVTVEQFATLFEPQSDNIGLEVAIPIKTNYDGRAFAVGADVQFTENSKTFLVAKVYCHYDIEKSCWDELSDGGTKDVELPKQFMDSLARIAVGTARGVICAKTENTPFSRYSLPVIELEPSQEGDSFIIPKP